MDAYRLCWRLQSAARLLSDRIADPDMMGEGGRAFVLRECGADTAQALTDRLEQASSLAKAVIEAHLKG